MDLKQRLDSFTPQNPYTILKQSLSYELADLAQLPDTYLQAQFVHLDKLERSYANLVKELSQLQAGSTSSLFSRNQVTRDNRVREIMHQMPLIEVEVAN